MDAKYINKNYLEESIKDYDNTIVSPIRNVVSNIYYNTADEFNIINAVSNTVQTIYDGLNNALGLNLQLNYINSTSPVNYQNVQQVVFTVGQIGNVWCDTPGKMGTQYYDWNPSTNTLTFSSMTGIVTFNTNMSEIFNNCKSLNQYIQIPSGVTNMVWTFKNCSNLNQNIQIPSSATDIRSVFLGCSSLNQNIQIPSGVTDMASVFQYCSNLNQNIQIPNSTTSMFSTFFGCSNLNQNIQIPSGVTDMASTFENCTSLNQNILIPNTVDTLGFKKGKTVPVGIFAHCVSLNKPIAIPNSVTNMQYTFNGCTSLNQDDMYIYSQNITNMTYAYNGVQHIGNIHIPTSVPKDTSNFMYNCLVNGNTGYTFASENIINDLPVDIAQWPPV